MSSAALVTIATGILVVASVQSEYQSKHLLAAVSSFGGRPSSRLPQRDIQYAVEEETAVGTQIGRGLRFDAGLEDKYAESVFGMIWFRFLNDPPAFLDFNDANAGTLKTTGRVDRERLCVSDDVVNGNQQYGGRPAGDLCRIKVDVAVQPMQYFEIIKVSIPFYFLFTVSWSL